MINKSKDILEDRTLRLKTYNYRLDFMLSLQRLRITHLVEDPLPEWYDRSWRNYIFMLGRLGFRDKNFINKFKSFNLAK